MKYGGGAVRAVMPKNRKLAVLMIANAAHSWCP